MVALDIHKCINKICQEAKAMAGSEARAESILIWLLLFILSYVLSLIKVKSLDLIDGKFGSPCLSLCLDYIYA